MRTLAVLTLVLAGSSALAQDLDVEPPRIRVEGTGVRYDGAQVRVDPGFEYEGPKVEVGEAGLEVDGWEGRVGDLVELEMPRLDLDAFGLSRKGLQLRLLGGRVFHDGGRFRIRNSGISLRDASIEIDGTILEFPRIRIGSLGFDVDPPKIRNRNEEEALAVAHLHALVAAQEAFRTGDLEKDGAADFANGLEELASSGALSGDLATGAAGSYYFLVQGGADSWSATATPEDGRGHRFYVDQTGVVRADPAGEAGPTSPPLE